MRTETGEALPAHQLHAIGEGLITFALRHRYGEKRHYEDHQHVKCLEAVTTPNEAVATERAHQPPDPKGTHKSEPESPSAVGNP